MDRKLEALVRRRARARCEYCHMPRHLDEAPSEIDHIVAEMHGGRTAASNLALSCFWCNRFKGPNLSGVDPKTGRITRLFHPRLHRWSYHFRWEGPRLRGRTAIGRTTIRVLKMNDPLRVMLRRDIAALSRVR